MTVTSKMEHNYTHLDPLSEQEEWCVACNFKVIESGASNVENFPWKTVA